MSTQSIVFEHPLNERMRLFLRLEHLFEKVTFFQGEENPWGIRAALEGLLDIAALSARSDMKTELLKELDRNQATLSRIQKQPGVDREVLEKILGELQQAIEGVRKVDNQIGQSLREDTFLKSITRRSALPGATCSFDLPQFHHWLHQPLSVRHRDMALWTAAIEPMRVGIALALSLARGSARPRQVHARRGFFQETLDSQLPAQLIQVTLDGQSAFFPEISGHKNRFSIRFLRDEGVGKPPRLVQEDLDFTLTCCIF